MSVDDVSLVWTHFMQSCLAAGFGSINAFYTENNELQNSDIVDSVLFVLSIKMANNMRNLD